MSRKLYAVIVKDLDGLHPEKREFKQFVIAESDEDVATYVDHFFAKGELFFNNNPEQRNSYRELVFANCGNFHIPFDPDEFGDLRFGWVCCGEIGYEIPAGIIKAKDLCGMERNVPVWKYRTQVEECALALLKV